MINTLLHDHGEEGRVRALAIGSVALISLTAFEALAVATVMPAVAADLHGLAVYSLAFGAPMATSVVGMAWAGVWADSIGARRPLGVGTGLLAVGLLGCGLAPHMATFVLGRGVQGLGAGMLTVSIYALVGGVVPEPQRPRIFAWFSAAWVLPAMVGPPISGLLLHTIGWRAVFLLVPALALPAGLIMWPAVRDAPRPSAEGPDGGRDGVRRRLLLATVAGAGAASLQVAGTRDDVAWRLVAAAALVVVVLSAGRLLPAGLFRLERGLPSVVAVRGLIGAVFAGAEAYLPLLLVRERRWEPAVAGLVLTLGAVAWFVGAWIQGRFQAPEARYPLSRAGTALLAAGVGTFLVAALPGVPGWIVAVGWGVAGVGIGMAYSSTAVLALHLSPAGRHGEASSALTTSESLTMAVLLAVGGALFAALLPPDVAADAPAGAAPYLAAIGVPALAAVTAAAAARRMTPTPR